MTTHLTAPVGNLPAEPNSFIGRERDLGELLAMLTRVRALTLCGPGGIGKTRLALRLAAALSPGYADGAWIVDLAASDPGNSDPGSSDPGSSDPGSSDPAGGVAGRVQVHGDLSGISVERIVPLLTAALSIRQEPDRLLADTLADALRPRTMLLILDTCEHLVQPCAELVLRLLADCPGLRVIATSREPLRFRGEIVWRVPPLGLPLPVPSDGVSGHDADAVARCEAIRLFVERAGAVRPGFRLADDNLAAVTSVCRTLDGVPLAIELAAARARSLSPGQISARLADRFDFLALGDRAAPPRQQTLRATVEWSYDLLTDPERTLLRRLSVFSGWSLDLAEQVCADSQLPAHDVLDLLTALIDKSLVTVDTELGGHARYRMLDTVRELAAQKAAAAGELPGLRAAHRDCMLAAVEEIAGQAFVRGDPSWPERVAMYHRVGVDRANFHLALAYCVQHGEAPKGLRMCHALSGEWLASGDVAEGAAWTDRLLAIDTAVPADLRARALAVRAELAFEQQDYQGAASFAHACLELSRAGGDGNPAAALRLMALMALLGGRLDEAMTHADSAVAAARQMHDVWEEGVTLAGRAAVIVSLGRLDEAQQAYQEALGVLADNNGWGVANVLYGLGQVARSRRDPEAAVRYFGAALAMYQQIDARPEMARCHAGIGWIALSQSDLAAARVHLTESMRLSLVTGHRLAIARGLAALAALAAASDSVEQAVRLTGAAGTLFAAIGAPPSATAQRRLDEILAAARDALGPESVATLLSEGGRLRPHQAALLPAAGQARDQAAGDGDGLSGDGLSGARHGSLMASQGGRTADRLLTEREREIAILVTRGLSNRDIGRHLFISQATAARHIANIFAKLGLRSRAQLVAWMAEHEEA